MFILLRYKFLLTDGPSTINKFASIFANIKSGTPLKELQKQQLMQSGLQKFSSVSRAKNYCCEQVQVITTSPKSFREINVNRKTLKNSQKKLIKIDCSTQTPKNGCKFDFQSFSFRKNDKKSSNYEEKLTFKQYKACFLKHENTQQSNLLQTSSQVFENQRQNDLQRSSKSSLQPLNFLLAQSMQKPLTKIMQLKKISSISSTGFFQNQENNKKRSNLTDKKSKNRYKQDYQPNQTTNMSSTYYRSNLEASMKDNDRFIFEELNTVAKMTSSLQISEKNKYHSKRPFVEQPQKPAKIIDFQLLKELGSGRYGKVFLVSHKKTSGIFALKVIPKKIIFEDGIQDQFIRQLKLQYTINHPNIIKMYGFFYDADYIYLVMEYCADGTLLNLMKQRSIFDQKDTLGVLSNLLEAVSYLHCKGIMHRDLKPQNIIIHENIYKICDFGWAVNTNGQARSTFCGTPLYLSPELLKGQKYNIKSDIWALGVLTYELVFGRPPFALNSHKDLQKIIKEQIYFPTWTGASNQLIELLKLMLYKNPQCRSSVNEILNHKIMRQFFGMKSLSQEINRLF